MNAFQDSCGNHDKVFVGTFFRHAEEMFATAREAVRDADGSGCEMDILVSPEGGIHILAAADWALEPLRLHHGASAAYRISRHAGSVRVEARSPGETCTLHSEAHARAGYLQAPDFPRYVTVN